jgi:hypothetical protein
LPRQTPARQSVLYRAALQPGVNLFGSHQQDRHGLLMDGLDYAVMIENSV